MGQAQQLSNSSGRLAVLPTIYESSFINHSAGNAQCMHLTLIYMHYILCTQCLWPPLSTLHNRHNLWKNSSQVTSIRRNAGMEEGCGKHLESETLTKPGGWMMRHGNGRKCRASDKSSENNVWFGVPPCQSVCLEGSGVADYATQIGSAFILRCMLMTSQSS